jgi:hypothetical protein
MKRDVDITVPLIIAGIILAGCPVRRGGLSGREGVHRGGKPSCSRTRYAIASK